MLKPDPYRTLSRATTLLCLAVLLLTIAVGMQWPLAGDSVLMHYVVFLTRHGFAPYRQIAEMNLPLTYMSEQTAMTLFGGGDRGWRVYDAALVLGIAACAWRMLRQRSPAAGLFAGALFAAVHLQDGIHMAGQRDLLVTLLQAAGGWALLQTFSSGAEDKPQSNARWMAALFGACSVAAACIKPPALLFAFAGVAWLWRERGRAAGGSGRSFLGLVASVVALVVAGGAFPVLLCALYLAHFSATGAFLHDLQGLIAYHASLERRSIGFLVGHIWSPVLPFVVLAAVAAATRLRQTWSRLDTLFALGAASGFVSYLVQGKGFPYQRYPFLLWTLLLCTSQLWAAMRRSSSEDLPESEAGHEVVQRRTAYSPFVSALAIGCGLVLMGVFVVRSTRFSKADPYAGLRSDLRAQNANLLDGKLQCLDTAGPCIGALYKERLTQSTGFLYDCYLLDADNAVVQEQRALFAREWEARPPRLVVLTNSNCFTGTRTFDKFKRWPWMQQQLAEYELVLERQPEQPLRLWSRPEQPYAYRILRKP